MKAAICYEFDKPLVIEDIQMREPGEGEVKIRVTTTAICHSDIHDMKGELGGPLPFVGGHAVGFLRYVLLLPYRAASSLCQ
jgi:Zn-dependent alcohol dehydrogenase